MLCVLCVLVLYVVLLCVVLLRIQRMLLRLERGFEAAALLHDEGEVDAALFLVVLPPLVQLAHLLAIDFFQLVQGPVLKRVKSDVQIHASLPCRRRVHQVAVQLH